jgi:AsmA protein
MGVVAATVLVVTVCVAVFLDVNRYKPSIEDAVSRSLGMEFRIRGNVALQLFPRPRLSLQDIHLTKATSEILSAEELQVSPRWIPLILQRHVAINRLTLKKPQIRIEERIALPRPETMRSLAVQDGEVSYLDPSSGRSVEVKGLEISLSGISWGESEGTQSPTLLKSLSLHGTLHATTLQIGTLRASDVKWGQG